MNNCMIKTKNKNKFFVLLFLRYCLIEVYIGSLILLFTYSYDVIAFLNCSIIS